jgi:energy-coupling factor transport system permease protein
MNTLKNIALGKYVAVDSPVHRLDPRTKLVATLALMITAVQCERLPALILFSVSVLVSARLSLLPMALLLRNLRPFLWLFAFTLIMHGLMSPGVVILPIPLTDLGFSYEGLRFGAFFSLRLAVVVSLASLLTLTTSPIEITDGLERLLNPLRRFGFPAHELAMMVTIALRFIPVLIEEAERLHKAQLARGADFSGGPIRRARQLLPLLVPLFLSAFSRADRLAIAMESRCYRGGVGRTNYRLLELGRRDVRAAVAVGLIIASAIMLGLVPGFGIVV